MTTTQPWEIEFDERYKDYLRIAYNNDGNNISDDLKSFITSTRLSAYAEGKKECGNDEKWDRILHQRFEEGYKIGKRDGRKKGVITIVDNKAYKEGYEKGFAIGRKGRKAAATNK